jgi:hypothetical protein
MTRIPASKPLAIVGLIALAALGGCQTADPAPVQIISKPKLDLPMPSALDLEHADFIVITPDNASEVFAELKRKNISPNLFAVTNKGYAAITKNNGKLRAYIAQQRNIINRYRDYYEK